MTRRSAGAVRPSGGVGVLGVAIGAVARRVDLWPTALRVWFTLVPSGWWRRPPFLPVPSRAYLEFRLLTAYGSAPRDSDRIDLGADLIAYLEWCRRWPTR